MSGHSSTIIENISSNICNLKTISGKIFTHIAGHFPQSFNVKKAGLLYKNVSYYQHDYSKSNQERFLTDFQSFDVDFIYDNVLILNEKLTTFLPDLEDIVQNHAPLKKLIRKDKKLRTIPWINIRIVKMMHLRDKILRKLTREPDSATNSLYKNLDIESISKLKECQKYFHEYFHSNIGHMQLLWKGIKLIISKESRANAINKLKAANCNSITDSENMAIILNDFFVILLIVLFKEYLVLEAPPYKIFVIEIHTHFSLLP